MNKPKNPQVFPQLRELRDRGQGGREYDAETINGMTLLDYFAGQVLQSYGIGTPYDSHQIAKSCYSIAEAMLVEREKRSK